MKHEGGMDIVRYRAAGGIVFDRDRVLLLRKPALNEIVLPKGHIEAGETPEEAAARETIEETGYSNVRLLADLGTAQAQFAHKGAWYIRDETYFVMVLHDHERHGGAYDDADDDRQTFERMWVPVEAAAEMMSFEPARTFVRRAVAWWRAHRDEAEQRKDEDG